MNDNIEQPNALPFVQSETVASGPMRKTWIDYAWPNGLMDDFHELTTDAIVKEVLSKFRDEVELRSGPSAKPRYKSRSDAMNEIFKEIGI